MHSISESNVPRIYSEAIEVMRHAGIRENSRNGAVITLQEPVLLTIENPMERVLFDHIRDANPFFHVMEFIWMMAGSDDAKWLAQFNKRYMEYSDDGNIVHASYGHRWRKAFGMDQIRAVVRMLRKDRESRRVVLGMWGPHFDLEIDSKDLPCNTQINFRVVNGRLDFTVINRSNDLFWGSLGANAVHMTMLHELIARAAGIPIGNYRVFTVNLHVYEKMPRFEELFQLTVADDRYHTEDLVPFPLLAANENIDDFIVDCEHFVYRDRRSGFNTVWMEQVGVPIWALWSSRSKGNTILAQDWSVACQEWVERRRK